MLRQQIHNQVDGGHGHDEESGGIFHQEAAGAGTKRLQDWNEARGKGAGEEKGSLLFGGQRDDASAKPAKIHEHAAPGGNVAFTFGEGAEGKGKPSDPAQETKGVHTNAQGMTTMSTTTPGKDPFRFNPRSKFFRNWDLLIAILLVYTAVFTPVEVSFFESKLNGLFVINRFVDLCFISDMVFNFLLPVQNEQGVWVTNSRSIAELYLKSWFPIDLVSVLPFDLVGVVSDSKDTSNLKILRIVRLFRLAKLLRLLRSGRMFQRWESTVAVNYAKMSLFKFMGITLAFAHWLACAFHILVTIEDNPDQSWIVHYPYLDDSDSRWAKYLTALYWAVATLSTLGYGDVVPSTLLERGFVVVCAMLGASVYAYMVGNVCSIIQGMDETNAKFNHMMDTLNVFMEEKALPQELRVRLRDFFRFRKSNAIVADWHKLLEEMSPALQSEVTNQLHAKWITKVTAFRGSSPSFITELALVLETVSFSAGELVIEEGSRANAMYIMERGVAAKEGRVISGGNFCGEDMLYATTPRTYNVRTLTNSVFLVLRREGLETVIQDHPAEFTRLRKYVVKVLLKKAFLDYAKAVKRLEKEGDVDQEDLENMPTVFHARLDDLVARRKGIRNALKQVTFVQRAVRGFLARRSAEEGNVTLGEKRAKKDWDKLVAVLEAAECPQYEGLLRGEGLTYSRLEALSADSLKLAGVRLGHGVDIMDEYRRTRARDARGGNPMPPPPPGRSFRRASLTDTHADIMRSHDL